MSTSKKVKITAAQHSIACYRQEAHETACRLERELNPLIV